MWSPSLLAVFEYRPGSIQPSQTDRHEMQTFGPFFRIYSSFGPFFFRALEWNIYPICTSSHPLNSASSFDCCPRQRFFGPQLLFCYLCHTSTTPVFIEFFGDCRHREDKASIFLTDIKWCPSQRDTIPSRRKGFQSIQRLRRLTVGKTNLRD